MVKSSKCVLLPCLTARGLRGPSFVYNPAQTRNTFHCEAFHKFPFIDHSSSRPKKYKISDISYVDRKGRSGSLKGRLS
ncbi:hypothetical protein B0H12DRAFT_323050 [Mycena haematopus]|nr:hypothetical protein B0H12DRAFT_323050 [Mycena haematopus]